VIKDKNMSKIAIGKSETSMVIEINSQIAPHAGNKTLDEFIYVDTATGDVKNRNKVMRIDEFTLPEQPHECYLSMFRFRKESQDHCLKTGSVKGNDQFPCNCDCLWFDIDREDLEKAQSGAIEMVTAIETCYEIKPESLELYFSGCKGFHIGIPCSCFGARPEVDLPMIFKKMAKVIAGDIEIDTAIYEKNRLWRIPGSINGKSGLYKIPLTIDELLRLRPEDIRKLAQNKREISFPKEAASSTPSRKLANLYESSKQRAHQPNPCPKHQETLKAIRPCINKLMEGLQNGKRNEAGIRLAVFYKNQGTNQDQVLLDLLSWNQKNRPPLPNGEIESIVKSAFTGNYAYGCNDELLKSLCKTDCPEYKKDNDQKPIYGSFFALSDGTLLEMVYSNEGQKQTSFAICNGDMIGYSGSFKDPITGNVYEPIKAGKIIQSNTIHFPSKAEEFGSEASLIESVNDFIAKYLVVSSFFHKICVYYVLFSWVYDKFTNVPYLRARGDYGSGKSRFLQTVGVLCYKPIFSTGAATVSPIFRLIDLYKGTLIVDESDFTDGDESHRMIKILNSGFQQGFPVLLSEATNSKKFEPTSYEVFGPKLIASQKEFKDKALESRCITEVMDRIIKPEHIPINLPLTFWDEARAIRNRLLTWRLKRYHNTKLMEDIPNLPVEPRLAQIMIPILSIINDSAIKDEFIDFMQKQNQRMIEERGETFEGKIARAICELWNEQPTELIRTMRITDKANKLLDNPDFKLSARKVGHIIRKTFNLAALRDNHGYYLEPSSHNLEKLINIANKYGIEVIPSPQCAQHTQCSPAVAEQGVML